MQILDLHVPFPMTLMLILQIGLLHCGTGNPLFFDEHTINQFKIPVVAMPLILPGFYTVNYVDPRSCFLEPQSMAQLLICGLWVVFLLSYCTGSRSYQERMRLGLFLNHVGGFSNAFFAFQCTCGS